MLGRNIDIGLIEGPPGTSEVRLEPFVQDEIVVVVAAEHPFAARVGAARLGSGLTLAELAAEPLLLRESGSGTRRVVEDALRKAGVALRGLRVVMELDSTEAIKSGVEAGLGVGFVSRWALRHICPHGPEPEGPAGAFLRFARQFREEYSAPA